MGSRGPLPESGDVLKLHGSKKKTGRKTTAPAIPEGTPQCPDWLPDGAKVEWHRAVKLLKAARVLAKADQGTLTSYCLAIHELRTATETLEREGRTFKTATGYLAPHPAVAQQRSAWAAVKTFSQLFGLDPASRGRLQVQASDVPGRQGVMTRNRAEGIPTRDRSADSRPRPPESEQA